VDDSAQYGDHGELDQVRYFDLGQLGYFSILGWLTALMDGGFRGRLQERLNFD
jgi:hypothetical protein